MVKRISSHPNLNADARELRRVSCYTTVNRSVMSLIPVI